MRRQRERERERERENRIMSRNEYGLEQSRNLSFAEGRCPLKNLALYAGSSFPLIIVVVVKSSRKTHTHAWFHFLRDTL
jgi:hypothetical protein